MYFSSPCILSLLYTHPYSITIPSPSICIQWSRSSNVYLIFTVHIFTSQSSPGALFARPSFKLGLSTHEWAYSTPPSIHFLSCKFPGKRSLTTKNAEKFPARGNHTTYHGLQRNHLVITTSILYSALSAWLVYEEILRLNLATVARHICSSETQGRTEAASPTSLSVSLGFLLCTHPFARIRYSFGLTSALYAQFCNLYAQIQHRILLSLSSGLSEVFFTATQRTWAHQIPQKIVLSFLC